MAQYDRKEKTGHKIVPKPFKFILLATMFSSGELFSSMSTADLPTQSAVLDQINDWKIQQFLRIMLVLAWLVAPVCSIPQSFIFRLKTHPIMQEYRCS